MGSKSDIDTGFHDARECGMDYPTRSGRMGRVLAILLVPLLASCSVVMATKQPSLKDMNVFRPGTERDVVIAQVGVPVSTEKLPDGRKDIYTFIQGYSSGAKAARAIFHGAADVFTIGIWEAIGTPIEGAFDGKKITERVFFDKDDRVKESTTLSVSDP
jgi:hypothetical protein